MNSTRPRLATGLTLVATVSLFLAACGQGLEGTSVGGDGPATSDDAARSTIEASTTVGEPSITAEATTITTPSSAVGPSDGIAADVAGSVTVEVAGPMVVGFALFGPDSPGEESALSHLGFALSDASACLEEIGAATAFYAARQIVFLVDDREIVVDHPDGEWPTTMGAHLIRPGADVATIHPASAGPSSLIGILPDAAADYFGVAPCEVN